MPKVDYIQLQIEQLSKFLAMAITKLTGKENTFDSDLKETESVLRSEYEIDLEKIKHLTSEQFILHVQNNGRFNFLNMEYLADLIALIADSETNPSLKQDYLVKSLALYIHLDKTERIYSEERKKKIIRITSQIES